MGSQRVGHDWATFTHTHNVYNLDNKWTLEIKYLRVFSPTLPCYFNVAPVGFQPVHFPYNIECYTEESFLVTLMDTKAIEIRKPVATANLSSISLSSYSLFFQGLLMLSHIARFPSFLCLNNIPINIFIWYIHVSHFLCPFIIDEHIGYLHILAIGNKPAINIRASYHF